MGVAEPATPDMDLATKIAARHAAIDAFFQTLTTRAALIGTMQKLNLAWGDVRDGRDIRDQPTVRSRGTVVDVDDRNGGTRPTTQSPYRFSAADSGVRGVTARRGEHNGAVLGEWLDKSSAEVDALLAAGVLQAEAANAGSVPD
jgi:crotonobetainyl-CoA:carnitine CoA-transferase CaiB-like acyl-CoA transferase